MQLMLQLPAADWCLPQECRSGKIFCSVNEFLRHDDIWNFSDLGGQCLIIRQIGVNQGLVPHWQYGTRSFPHRCPRNLGKNVRRLRPHPAPVADDKRVCLTLRAGGWVLAGVPAIAASAQGKRRGRPRCRWSTLSNEWLRRQSQRGASSAIK